MIRRLCHGSSSKLLEKKRKSIQCAPKFHGSRRSKRTGNEYSGILIPLPDLRGRISILKLMLDNAKMKKALWEEKSHTPGQLQRACPAAT
jgi:hypothetical protein